MRFQTSGSACWDIAAASEAETESNAGSNLVVTAYNDSGAFIGAPMEIVRASGEVVFTPFAANVTALGIDMPTGTVNSAPGIQISGYSPISASIRAEWAVFLGQAFDLS